MPTESEYNSSRTGVPWVRRNAPEKEKHMPISFEKDIKPMFRPIDIEHMKRYNVPLDDYTYMSDPANG